MKRFIALLLLVFLATAAYGSSLAAPDSFAALSDALTGYLSARGSASDLIISVCDRVEAFLDTPSYENLLKARVRCDEACRAAAAEIRPSSFDVFTDEDILFLGMNGIEMDAVEAEMGSQSDLVVNTVTPLAQMRSYLYDDAYDESAWSWLRNLTAIQRETARLDAAQAALFVNYLLVPVKDESFVAALWGSLPALCPVLDDRDYAWSDDQNSLQAKSWENYAEYEEILAALNNLITRQEGMLTQAQAGENTAKRIRVFDDIPPMLPLPVDWLFPEPFITDPELQEQSGISEAVNVSMDYAFYREDAHDQFKYILKIDTGAMREQVEAYTGLLAEFGAELNKTETTDTGVTWYFTYRNSVFLVSWEPDLSFIMYYPEQLSFEEISYVAAAEQIQ